MKKDLVEKKKKRSSREIILKEAFKLFLQRNVEKVTVPDIEKATGVQRGAIFYHFKDKEALFIEVVDKYFFSELNIFYPLDPNGLSSFEEYIKQKNKHLDYIKNWFLQENLILNPYTSFFHLCSQANLYYPTFKNEMFRLLNMDKLYWQKAAEIDNLTYSGVLPGNHVGEVFRSAYLEKCFSACYNETNNISDVNRLKRFDLL